MIAPPSKVSSDFRTGLIAIVGKPNVGKSTLLNRLIGQKISIVSRKAQTTRHRVTGILNEDAAQFVFVDTPGFQTHHRSLLNQSMNRAVTRVLAEVDLVLLVIAAGRFDEADRKVLSLLPPSVATLLVINKIDRMPNREQLLPFIAMLSQEHDFDEIIPISAEKGSQLEELLTAARSLLPLAPPMFGENEITDRSERFLAAEFLREKLFRLLGDELPYGMTVEIERFVEEAGVRRIFAAIIVDRASHKGMLIGHKGERLKRISSEARVELEKLFAGKVYLEVWVKVKSGWNDDERVLKSLGYE